VNGITKELRRIIENATVTDDDYPDSEWVVISKRMALALADEIDAEHEHCIEHQSYDRYMGVEVDE
jgi:hypothetical protein